MTVTGLRFAPQTANKSHAAWHKLGNALETAFTQPLRALICEFISSLAIAHCYDDDLSAQEKRSLAGSSRRPCSQRLMKSARKVCLRPHLMSAIRHSHLSLTRLSTTEVCWSRFIDVT